MLSGEIKRSKSASTDEFADCAMTSFKWTIIVAVRYSDTISASKTYFYKTTRFPYNVQAIFACTLIYQCTKMRQIHTNSLNNSVIEYTETRVLEEILTDNFSSANLAYDLTSFIKHKECVFLLKIFWLRQQRMETLRLMMTLKRNQKLIIAAI